MRHEGARTRQGADFHGSATRRSIPSSFAEGTKARGPTRGRHKNTGDAARLVRLAGTYALHSRGDFGYIRALSGRGEAHLTAAILDAPGHRRERSSASPPFAGNIEDGFND